MIYAVIGNYSVKSVIVASKKTLYFCSAPPCALISMESMTFSPADVLTSARTSPYYIYINVDSVNVFPLSLKF